MPIKVLNVTQLIIKALSTFLSYAKEGTVAAFQQYIGEPLFITATAQNEKVVNIDTF
jgi:hypothetical protein